MISAIPFVPAIAGSGLGAWARLEQTRADDIARLTEAPAMTRVRDDAADELRTLTSLSELVENRRLLEVVLGAHGLADQVDNRALVTRVIEQGPGQDGLAGRLGDVRWLELARTFSSGVRGLTDATITRILDAHARETHTALVTREQEGLGTALAARDRLEDLAADGASDRLVWLSVIGDDSLRRIFETTLGLPQSFWTLDVTTLERRLGEAFEARFGTSVSAAIADPDTRESILERAIALDAGTRAQTTSAGAIALSLLSAA